MTTGSHLPVLVVVVPLIGAPLAVLLRGPRIAWAIAMAASVFFLAASLGILAETRAVGPISYAIGQWAPPLGIEYRIDALNAFVLVLLGLTAVVVAPYAWTSVAAEIPAKQRYLFYALFCLALAGLGGITVTGDAFNLFVFLEISSLASYVLIALARDRRALFASYQYLVLGTIGATFYVIGVGLVYLMTGTLNFADEASRLAGSGQTRPILAALAFLTVGISLKAALFPLHMWLPGAYAYAPSAVTALLAATATKVSIYVLIRLYFTVFGASVVFGAMPMGDVLLALSITAMIIASLAAVFQTDLKRLLAYSSIGQIGYITLGVSLATTTGLTGAIVHLFNHGVTKGALFLLAGAIVYRTRSARLDRMAGIGRSMPLTCAGIVVGGLGLVGVPGTAGFVTKWTLALAAIQTGAWWIAFIVVASSLIAVAYVWKFVEVAYFHAPDDETAAFRDAPPGLLVPAFMLLAASIYFGIDPSFPLGAASDAAATVSGGAR